jgi:formylmethanofuran dehydrogenase subunit E
MDLSQTYSNDTKPLLQLMTGVAKMLRYLLVICLVGLTTPAGAENPIECLPTPEHQPVKTDPAWLSYAAQFHGHLGPWATAGLRVGMTARHAAEAKGYFDVQLTVEGPFAKPPQSCFLDGLQVTTGATLGKRNLKWIKADKVVVRLENTKTGKQVEVRPTPELMSLLTSFKPKPKTAHSADDHHEGDDQKHLLEDIARRIAKMPEEKILQVKILSQ